MIVDKFGRYLIGLVLVVLLGVACWYWYKSHRGKVAAETHVEALQADSTKSWKLNGKLQKQADDAIFFANRYKASRDSAITASDRNADKLTYSQKVVAYLKALVDNKTLPAQPNRPIDLTADDVVTAGLKTANREEIQRNRGDSLAESVAARDARILALREDKLNLKAGLVEVKRKAGDKAKGGLWPFNIRRIKEEKQLEKFADDALKKSESEESELEREVNKKY